MAMTPTTLLLVLIVFFAAAWASSTRSTVPAIRAWMFAHTLGICGFTMLVVMGALIDTTHQDRLMTAVCAALLIGYARIGPKA
jgi:hypothetical protein